VAHITPRFVARRLRKPVSRLPSPYLQHVPPAVYRERYRDHVDYHVHFLAGLFWSLWRAQDAGTGRGGDSK
jgi:hypothetical protein